eukprot:2662356-Ditylum_brightwellii.AAC.1
MECTDNSSDQEKWFFIVKKCNTEAASKFLDRELQFLYQQVVPDNLHFNHVPIPRQAQTKRAQSIGSYTNVLMGWANPQEEDKSNFNLNKKSLSNLKRMANAITM